MYLAIWEIRIKETKNIDKCDLSNYTPDPIIIYSYDPIELWLSNYPDQSILLSPGISWVQLPLDDEDEIKNFSFDKSVLYLWIQKHKKHYQAFLERVLKHDIANEFGAIMLANGIISYLHNMIDTNNQNRFRKLITSEEYDVIRKKVTTDRKTTNRFISLYTIIQPGFQTPIKEIEKIQYYYFDEKGKYTLKILYIDDCGKKGWDSVLTALIRDPVQCLTIKDSYIDLQSTLQKERANKLYLAGYDMVLLDLNLIEGESSESSVVERTGYKILELIRDIDLVIPVVMLTGSDKQVNMKGLQKFGIVEFVTKPFPGYELTNIQAENLISAFDKCEKAKWLHILWYLYVKLIEKSPDKIKKKFLVALHKLLNKVYYTDVYDKKFIQDDLYSIMYNEAILYIHSILTSVLQIKAQQKGVQKVNIDKGINETCRNLDFISLNKDFINRFNFQLDNLTLLKGLNDLRNKIFPMHGDKNANLAQVICYTISMLYEVKEIANTPWDSDIKSKLQLLMSCCNYTTDVSNDLKELIR